MQIGFDARLVAYREGGIARYARSLLAALINQDRANSYTIFLARGGQSVVDAYDRGDQVMHRKLLTPPHHRLERARDRAARGRQDHPPQRQLHRSRGSRVRGDRQALIAEHRSTERPRIARPFFHGSTRSSSVISRRRDRSSRDCLRLNDTNV